MKIEEAIQQKSFKSELHKAHINVLYTAAMLSHRSVSALKPYKLSWQQFNILRILKGMHPEPATVKLLTNRMIDKMSNASRLVDKLKLKGYVERKACKEDRRRVNVMLTDLGMGVLEKASETVENMVHESVETFSEEDARLLNQLLDQFRG